MWLLAVLACPSGSDGPFDPPDPWPVVPPTTTALGSTPPVDGCPVLGDVSVETSPGNPLERRFVASLDGPAALFAICTAPDAPDERILAEAPTPSATQTLVVRGLREWTR